MHIVFIGLAITSSWGNGHATTYRALIKGLHARGHRVTFLEQDRPWYAEHRDAPSSPHCDVHLYATPAELRARFGPLIRGADATIVGSYVAEGAEVGDWVLQTARGVRAFYDIDTPVTLAALAAGDSPYLRRDQVAEYDAMLSFTGGPTLERLRREFGARHAFALYCSVDADRYRPVEGAHPDLDLGYMGTYSDDRQPGVEALLNAPARALPGRRFAVAGAQYPPGLAWPPNVERIEHLPPSAHAAFYGRSRYTLNVTRADMRAAGWSPSVRLFEAGACGVPIVSDAWDGLEDVLVPGEEILAVERTEDVVEVLTGVDDVRRRAIGARARERVLATHAGEQRAIELERALGAARSARGPSDEALRGERQASAIR